MSKPRKITITEELYAKAKAIVLHNEERLAAARLLGQDTEKLEREVDRQQKALLLIKTMFPGLQLESIPVMAPGQVGYVLPEAEFPYP